MDAAASFYRGLLGVAPVADLDVTCNDLRAQGISCLVEPSDYPWGRSAYFRDPDGRLVELAEESS